MPVSQAGYLLFILLPVMGDLDAWSPKMLEPVLALYGREYLVKMMADWHKGILHIQILRPKKSVNHLFLNRCARFLP